MQDRHGLRLGYLAGQSGSLQITQFLPRGRSNGCWVMHLPAFAEEMNKSRAMVAAQARALAAEGVAVVVPDLLGTGDSDGDFQDADWDTWKADLLALVARIRQRAPTRLVLWGHRMGCLLAVELVAEMASAPDQLVLWQPVHQGRLQLSQFLRLRVAAGLTGSGNGSQTVADLQAELAGGSSVEVAGYRLSAALYHQLGSRQLSELALPAATAIHVLEVVASSAANATPVTRGQVEQWRQQGLDCRLDTATGDPFWTTQEGGTAPALVELTTSIILERHSISADESPASASHPTKLEATPVGVPGLAADSAQGERALVFACEGRQLAAVLHGAGTAPESAVVIVVGGPQYRVGSHRQFVLLARALAANGLPCLRFDYRGMGDSGGDYSGFVDIAADIGSALDTLQQTLPTVREVTLWGLCDAATAALCYAPGDPRVSRLVLANPWVFSEQGAAKAYLKHYYARRLLSRAFWVRLFGGGVSVGRSLASVLRFARESVRAPSGEAADSVGERAVELLSRGQLSDACAAGLEQFPGRVLLILSGNDLTAAQFADASQSHAGLRAALERENVTRRSLPGVDHTFSRAEWRAEVEALTVEFLLHSRD